MTGNTSEYNKKALLKYKSLESKIEKAQKNINEAKEEKRKLLEAIPYPIFIKESENVIVAYLNPQSKIIIERSKYAFAPKYRISYHDAKEEGNNPFSSEKYYDIQNVKNRTTKKEFMEIYREAQKSIKEAMLLTTRVKKYILCEKTIKEDEE